jgi:hypothetical protein
VVRENTGISFDSVKRGIQTHSTIDAPTAIAAPLVSVGEFRKCLTSLSRVLYCLFGFRNITNLFGWTTLPSENIA